MTLVPISKRSGAELSIGGARPRVVGIGRLLHVKTVVVLAGGPDRPAVVLVPPDATVIAADSGAELGGPIDLLVGDLDSISAETLSGIEHVERHRVDKDATDLELALTAAMRLEPERILVLGSAAGRGVCWAVRFGLFRWSCSHFVDTSKASWSPLTLPAYELVADRYQRPRLGARSGRRPILTHSLCRAP